MTAIAYTAMLLIRVQSATGYTRFFLIPDTHVHVKRLLRFLKVIRASLELLLTLSFLYVGRLLYGLLTGF